MNMCRYINLGIKLALRIGLIFVAFILIGNHDFASAQPAMDEKQKESLQNIEADGNQEIQASIGKKKMSFFKRFMNKAYFWRLKYYFVAQNTKNCDIFYGLVQDDPLTGHASVEFTFPNGCQCHGHAQVTRRSSTSTSGQSGWVHAKCADGREIKGRFTTTSLTTGYWNAKDNLGNDYDGSFGHTAEQALERVNAIRRKLHCPECSPQEIELKVYGQVITPRQDPKAKSQ